MEPTGEKGRQEAGSTVMQGKEAKAQAEIQKETGKKELLRAELPRD